MRTAYSEQMAELAQTLGEAAALAGDAMEEATTALLNADLTAAENVITEYDKVAELTARCEERAMSLLALQAPVAGDLRAIVGAIQLSTDVNRMGALALHVAKITRRRHPNNVLPEEVRGYFSEMGRIAVILGRSAKEVLDNRDPDLARDLDTQDEAMDDLHKHLFTVLMDRDWKHGVTAAVDITLLGRFYERFADHAVEVGRRVVYLVTGTLPELSDHGIGA